MRPLGSKGGLKSLQIKNDLLTLKYISDLSGHFDIFCNAGA